MTVTEGDETSLTIATDDNLLTHIDTRVTGATLEISTEPGIDIDPTDTVVYEVTLPDIVGLTLAGAGRIEMGECRADSSCDRALGCRRNRDRRSRNGRSRRRDQRRGQHRRRRHRRVPGGDRVWCRQLRGSRPPERAGDRHQLGSRGGDGMGHRVARRNGLRNREHRLTTGRLRSPRSYPVWGPSTLAATGRRLLSHHRAVRPVEASRSRPPGEGLLVRSTRGLQRARPGPNRRFVSRATTRVVFSPIGRTSLIEGFVLRHWRRTSRGHVVTVYTG